MGIDQIFDWCRVEVVIFLFEDQIIYDGFIENYIVVDDIVYLYGKKGKLYIGLVFLFVMECDVVVNFVDQVFMFFNILFCLIELSWDEYLFLIVVVCQVMFLIDSFWYSLNEYYDNLIVGVLDWFDYDVCSEFVQCICKGYVQCKMFEEVMERFV